MNILNLSINILNKGGKKAKSEKVMKNVLINLKKHLKKENIKESEIKFYLDNLELSSPLVSIVLKKKGGRVYKLPAPIKKKRKAYTSIIWLRDKCKENIEESLLKEIIAINKESVMLESKRVQLHSVAASNRVHIRFLSSKLKA